MKLLTILTWMANSEKPLPWNFRQLCLVLLPALLPFVAFGQSSFSWSTGQVEAFVEISGPQSCTFALGNNGNDTLAILDPKSLSILVHSDGAQHCSEVGLYIFPFQAMFDHIYDGFAPVIKCAPKSALYFEFGWDRFTLQDLAGQEPRFSSVNLSIPYVISNQANRYEAGWFLDAAAWIYFDFQNPMRSKNKDSKTTGVSVSGEILRVWME